MADKNSGISTGECGFSASPSLSCAGLKTIYHALEGEVSISVHPSTCPDVFLDKAVPIENDSTAVVLPMDSPVSGLRQSSQEMVTMVT